MNDMEITNTSMAIGASGAEVIMLIQQARMPRKLQSI